MNTNRGGEIAVAQIPRTRAERMARYDALPPRVRKLLQDAPYNLSVTHAGVLMKSDKANRATLTRIARESALATYGSNYPIDLIKV